MLQPQIPINTPTKHPSDQGSRLSRRYMSCLQCHERSTRTIYVSSFLPVPLLDFSPTRPPPPYIYIRQLINPQPSKWFMLSIGAKNLHKMLSGFDDKSAQAICTFGYCEGPGHEPVLFQGRTDGTLVESRGSTAFGEF